jgi:hypothetical protein
MRIESLNRIPLATVLALAAATLASCARVEADIPDTRVTEKSVNFQGIPGSQLAGEVSITQSFTLTSDDLSWVKNLNSEVYAYEVEMTAAAGVQDLGFIHYARVTMASGETGADATPTEVVNYERPDDFTPSPALHANTTYPVDVTKAWAAKKVIITLQLVGIFPEQDWAVDVTLHMSGKISYKF